MRSPFDKDKQNNTDSENDDTNVAANKFLGKLSEFFSTEPQKEKVLRHEDFTKAGDTYYATVSASYKVSQRILVLVLVFFLVFSLVVNFREITYDNFFYLLKDFSAAANVNTGSYDILSYDSNTRHFFSLYRGGLVVVNPSNLSVFTSTGRNTLKTTSTFSSPCVESSGKYFIIYDTAGDTFSVYNSFARIYSETLDYPVTAAAFSEDGQMAIVTRDISHKSMVHVYNKNFKKHFTVPSNSFAFDVAMSSDYDKIAISYYEIGDGSGKTRLVIRNLSDAEEVSNISIDGEFILGCSFISDGKFAVITDRTLRIYDKYFEELDQYEYGDAVISGYSSSEYGIAVSYTVNSKNIAVVFDKFGNMTYNEEISDNIKDIGLFEDCIFMRTDSGVLRIAADHVKEQLLPSDQGKMLIYSENTVLVCGDSKAEYLVFDD